MVWELSEVVNLSFSIAYIFHYSTGTVKFDGLKLILSLLYRCLLGNPSNLSIGADFISDNFMVYFAIPSIFFEAGILLLHALEFALLHIQKLLLPLIKGGRAYLLIAANVIKFIPPRRNICDDGFAFLLRKSTSLHGNQILIKLENYSQILYFRLFALDGEPTAYMVAGNACDHIGYLIGNLPIIKFLQVLFLR